MWVHVLTIQWLKMYLDTYFRMDFGFPTSMGQLRNGAGPNIMSESPSFASPSLSLCHTQITHSTALCTVPSAGGA